MLHNGRKDRALCSAWPLLLILWCTAAEPSLLEPYPFFEKEGYLRCAGTPILEPAKTGLLVFDNSYDQERAASDADADDVWAEAVRTRRPKRKGELPLVKGQRIRVVSASAAQHSWRGWWVGETSAGGFRGKVHAKWLRRLDATDMQGLPHLGRPLLTPELRSVQPVWRDAGLLRRMQQRILFIGGLREAHCAETSALFGDGHGNTARGRSGQHPFSVFGL